MKSSQNSSVDNQISVYDMTSARFAEGRAIGADVVSIYEIASRYNRSLAEGNPDAAFRLETKPLAEVAKYQFPGRKHLTAPLQKNGANNRTLHKFTQPCLVIDDEGVRTFFDGVGRFNRLAMGQADSIRLIVLSKSDALLFGRPTIDVIDSSGNPLALDQLKSAQLTSPSVLKTGSKKIPVPVLTGSLRQTRAAQKNVTPVRMPGAIVPDNVLLVQTVSNVSVPFNQELTSFVRNNWTSDYANAGKAGLFPVSVAIDSSLFGQGNAKKSYQDISIVVFLVTICHTIGEIENRLNAKNRRSGHSIVHASNLYKQLIQQSPRKRRSKKQRDYLSSKNFSEWKNDIVLNWNVLGYSIDFDFIKVKWPHIDISEKSGVADLNVKCLQMFEWGLRAYWRSEFMTSSMRNIDANNFGHGSIKSARKPFEEELYGTDEDQQQNHIDNDARAVLALYGRVNGGKLWQDRHLDVLRYDWHIAIGDLVRNQSMFVTRMMAQEFIIYNGLHAGGDEDTLQYDWSLVHAGLAHALRQHPARAKAFADLIEVCWRCMRENRALRVTVHTSTTQCFDSANASREDSAAGDAVTLFI